jgi:hypothetical protein
MTQFRMPSYTFLHAMLVQTLQSLFLTDSLDSSLSQRTVPLDLNDSLFCRGLGPHGLCHTEMTVVDWSYEMGAWA